MSSPRVFNPYTARRPESTIKLDRSGIDAWLSSLPDLIEAERAARTPEKTGCATKITRRVMGWVASLGLNKDRHPQTVEQAPEARSLPDLAVRNRIIIIGPLLEVSSATPLPATARQILAPGSEAAAKAAERPEAVPAPAPSPQYAWMTQNQS